MMQSYGLHHIETNYVIVTTSIRHVFIYFQNIFLESFLELTTIMLRMSVNQGCGNGHFVNRFRFQQNLDSDRAWALSHL